MAQTGMRDHNKIKKIKKIKKIVPGTVLRRQPPRNLEDVDEWMFVREYRRELPSVGIRILSPAYIRKKSLYGGLFRRAQGLVTHPWGVGAADAYRWPVSLELCQRQESVPFEKAVLVTDNWSANYFHWMVDSLQRVLVAQMAGINWPIMLPEYFAGQAFVRESLDFLGLSYEICADDQLQRVKTLATITSAGPSGNPHPILVGTLSKMLRAANGMPCKPEAHHAAKRLWVSRKNSGKRRISNEEVLLPLLNEHGFESVYSEDLSFVDQMELFSQASVIVGMHGAGLTNMLVAKPGATILEIRRRDDDSNNCYFALASAIGHEYWYLQADTLDSTNPDSDVSVRPDELDLMLTRVLNSGRNR